MSSICQRASSFPKEDVEQSIPARFERIAEESERRIAVRTRQQTLTYGALNDAANRVAWAILDECGSEAEPVALLQEQSASLIASILGVLKAGKIYVPLDTSHPRARLHRLVEDSQARVLVCDDRHRALAEELAGDRCRLVCADGLGALARTENPEVSIGPDALCGIFYTSGSTGEPKGVLQNHRNLLWDARRQTKDLEIHAEDRFALLFSCGFSASVSPLFGALLNGAGLFPFWIEEEGPARLASWLNDEGITICDMTVMTFRSFARELGDQGFPGLRLLSLGGEPVRRGDIELYRAHFPPGCILQNALATTETRVISQYFVTHEKRIEGGLVPVGYPVEGKEVLLLDEAGRAAGVDEAGEIVVRSRYLSPGYWRRPDLTQAAFSPDPDGGDCRVYRTGDLGRRGPDGCLVHLGRKDRQVKVRGHRVEIAEVESALLDLNTVKEAFVLARPDESGGSQSLVAYIVPSIEPAPPASNLRRDLAKTLPSFMIPSRFVAMAALPLNRNGKVDREALPAPDFWQGEPGGGFVAPVTREEMTIAAIWQEVLHLDQVGIRDSFLDLGGDSLLAVRMFSRIQSVFGVDLPLATLFRAPTVERLAAVCREANPGAPRLKAIPIQPKGDRPPFVFVDAYPMYRHLARRLGPDQPLLGLPSPDASAMALPYRLEDFAALQVRLIREIQPVGPYFLGGWSASAMLAYEVAQQIQRQGEKVGLLVLFDIEAETGVEELSPAIAAWSRACRFAQNLRFHCSKLLTVGGTNVPAYLGERLKWMQILASARLWTVLYRMHLMAGWKLDGWMLNTDRILHHSFRCYRPRPYSGRVVVFQRSERPVDRYRDPGSGWDELVTGGLEVYEVPGDHMSIFLEPNVKVMAMKLRECLTDAQRTG